MVRWFLILCSMMTWLAGCSPDVQEISDIALVMATGIDYNKDTHKYVFTSYCVLPTTTSMEKTGKLSEWVATATGNSILDAARNLRDRAGKTLVWQHNKFFIVGEAAARNSLYDIVDFLTRNRQFRITSYLIVSEGKAEEKLNVKSEIRELVSNELLGIIRNEKEWGKSFNLIVKDIANRYSSPYRGFVLGRLNTSRRSKNTEKFLFLRGGAVINKGKLVDWLDGDEVRVVHLFSEKSQWKDFEFTETVDFKSTKVTIYFKVADRIIRSNFAQGKPNLDIKLNLKATLGEMNHHLAVSDTNTLMELEQAASKHVERMMDKSLNHFQKGLKVDLLGFSDYFIQYHPKSWEKLKNEWEDVYPTMPIQVHAVVRIEKLGMIQTIGDH
jgi:spore germination protein KC